MNNLSNFDRSDNENNGSAFNVEEQNGQLVIDSRIIAANLDIEHKNLLATLDKYLNQIESKFGAVAFETRVVKRPQGGSYKEKWAWLNEQQATFVMTLSRNSDRVIECKLMLVEAFAQAKKIIQELQQPVQRVLPQHSAVEYANAAIGVEQMPDGILKQLLKDAIVDELSLQQNLKYLPVAEKPKQYTIVKVRAKKLGYSDAQIGNGSALGKFVRNQVEPAFQEMVGRYPVFHYEINDRLDRAIQLFFS